MKNGLSKRFLTNQFRFERNVAGPFNEHTCLQKSFEERPHVPKCTNTEVHPEDSCRAGALTSGFLWHFATFSWQNCWDFLSSAKRPYLGLLSEDSSNRNDHKHWDTLWTPFGWFIRRFILGFTLEFTLGFILNFHFLLSASRWVSISTVASTVLTLNF